LIFEIGARFRKARAARAFLPPTPPSRAARADFAERSEAIQEFFKKSVRTLL
jgi:hypothetical protein